MNAPEQLDVDASAGIGRDNEAFGIRPPAIDNPARRLEAWAGVCIGGAMNTLTVDGVAWSWSTQPRLQKNGAAIGRVYVQRRGEFMRDVGAYKIDACGRVLQLPAELRAVLPGGLEAEASVPAIDDEAGRAP